MRAQAGIIAFALFGFCPGASAQSAPPPFAIKQVGPGVYAAIDGPEHKAGSNAGFVIGDDGVLVVDAFFTLDAARALVAEIHRLTPKPIRYVVNTHYHLDHTGGDQALRMPAQSSSPTGTSAAGFGPRTSICSGPGLRPSSRHRSPPCPCPT